MCSLQNVYEFKIAPNRLHKSTTGVERQWRGAGEREREREREAKGEEFTRFSRELYSAVAG